ncbi:hypothetical protein [Streptomyces sp. SAS_272]|uniref:hypothetical protein n=1 Tax=Streptomyces sp. SAS_272 TaxID=3412747 RepID=UPI00403C21F6
MSSVAVADMCEYAVGRRAALRQRAGLAASAGRSLLVLLAGKFHPERVADGAGRIFGEEDTRFVLEDFSTCRISDIEQARQIFGEAQAHAARDDGETSEDLLAEAYDLVPAIRLILNRRTDESP